MPQKDLMNRNAVVLGNHPPITKCVSLLAVQPPSAESEEQSERGSIVHGRNLYHDRRSPRRRPSIQLPDVRGECLRHLRQAQLRVGGEAYLQAEERGEGPEADDDACGAGMLGRWARGRRCSNVTFIVVLLVTMTERTG